MLWLVKSFLSLGAAFLVSGLVISFVEWIGHQIYPVVGLDSRASKHELKQKIAQLPVGAFIFVELAYVLGGLCGGAVVCFIVLPKYANPIAILLASALTACGILNLLAIPHPLWFSIISTVSYFPSVFAGVYITNYLRS